MAAFGLVTMPSGLKLDASCFVRVADRDAKYIHKAMAGFGTKDKLLILRIVRAKWNPAHLAQVKQAYQAKRGKREFL